jgi:hypothetical protein
MPDARRRQAKPTTAARWDFSDAWLAVIGTVAILAFGWFLRGVWTAPNGSSMSGLGVPPDVQEKDASVRAMPEDYERDDAPRSGDSGPP